MPAEPATGAVGMVPDELKHEPRSKGISTPRKKKPKELAVITECCTGCAGSPACVEYCPVEDCMFWVPDEDNPPFGRIQVDPILCIGCKKCTSKGPDGAFLDRSEEHTSELQSPCNLVCRLLLEKKKKIL